MTIQDHADAAHAWTLAFNLNLDDTVTPARRKIYAELLALHCDGDLARLTAAAEACQAERAVLATAGHTVTRDETDEQIVALDQTLELIDTAAAIIAERQNSRAGAAPGAVTDELRAELFPEAQPLVQDPWHKHERRRRLLRRGNPLWWLRRLAARRARYLHVPADKPAGVEQLKIFLGEREIGRVKYQLCHQCRKARLGKIAVNPSWQGRGIGTRAIRHLRRQASGYNWSTTTQYETARSYWVRVAQLTGDRYSENPADECPHIAGALGGDLEQEASL